MSALDYLKPLRIAVGVPSTGVWPEPFATSLLGMQSMIAGRQIGKFKEQGMILISIVGSMIHNSRLDILKAAVKSNCTHLMFVDSDQTFPRDTIHRLISHNKDVVAANIATKRIPAQSTARKAGGKDGLGVPIFTTDESTGLEKCWRVGTGLIMMKRSVLDKIGLNVFCPRWLPDHEKYSGEDWPLMEAIEKAGFDIWIDHDLSKEVGHIGHFIYGSEHVMDLGTEPTLEVMRHGE